MCVREIIKTSLMSVALKVVEQYLMRLGWDEFATITKEMIHLQFLDVFEALLGTSADVGLLVATAEPFGTTHRPSGAEHVWPFMCSA